MEPTPDPAPFLPLAPASLHVVLALSRGEQHGYGLMGDVERLSDGVIKMGPGTLYGSIKKLLGRFHATRESVRRLPDLQDE